MSLSWRRRQAIASDQKTWRGLGVDSALWTSIDRNATNVKASLGNSGTKGVVTGLKFVKTEGLNLIASTGADIGTIWVSDVSNATVASEDGINEFDTPNPTSTAGNGLAINIKRFGAETFNTQPVPHDISGIKYHIVNGGSGYKAGDTFTLLQGDNQYGKKVTIGGSTTEATALTAGDAVQQEAYKITDIACTPSGIANAGAAVVLTLSSGGPANGFLVAGVNGASTSIKVISALDQPFDSTLGTGLTIGGAGVTGSFGTGVENTRKAAVNGFITNQSDGGNVTDPEFYQTLAQFQAGQFEKVFSKYVTGSTTVIAELQAGAAGTIATIDAEFTAPTFPNVGPKLASFLEGRLSVEITSVTNTSPEAGRY